MRPSECAKVSGSRSSGSSGTTLSTAEQDAACLGDRHQHWSAVLVSIRVRGTVMTAGCGRSLMDGVAWVWQVAAEVVRVRPSPRVTARIKKWGEQSQRPQLSKKKLTGRCSSCATAVVQYAAANHPNVTSSKWAWTRNRRWLKCITSITSITVAANAGKDGQNEIGLKLSSIREGRQYLRGKTLPAHRSEAL